MYQGLSQVILSVNQRKIVQTNMISFVSFANRNIIFRLYDFSLYTPMILTYEQDTTISLHYPVKFRLYSSIDSIDSCVFVFFHWNDETFLPINSVRMNLTNFFRFYSKNHIIRFNSRNIRVI